MSNTSAETKDGGSYGYLVQASEFFRVCSIAKLRRVALLTSAILLSVYAVVVYNSARFGEADTSVVWRDTHSVETGSDVMGEMVLHDYSMRVTNDMIVDYQAALPRLLPNYKNPCWLEPLPEQHSYLNNYYMKLHQSNKCPHHAREATHFYNMDQILNERCARRDTPCWRIRCFPYFFVLGSTKSGTTDLYSSLTSYHRQIENNTRKETQFWPRARHRVHTCNDETTAATYTDFIEIFDWAAERIRQDVTYQGPHPYHSHIVGEYTPANYYCQMNWHTWKGNINQSEPRVILAHLLYHIRPQTKFLFTMREPVARAIPNHNMANRLSGANVSVNLRLWTHMREAETCLAQHSPRYCVYTYQRNLVVRGMYGVFLRHWFDVFPRNQFLMIQFEEYGSDKVKVVNKIAKFLELDPLTPDATERMLSSSVVGHHAEETEKPTQQLIDRLQQFYRPWNRQLAELLADDRFNWDY